MNGEGKDRKQADEDSIRTAVRERYTKVALRGSSCCPSGDPMCGCGGLYPSSESSSLPGDALAASAGCGNPTAIAALEPGMVVVDLGSGGGIDAFLASKKVGPEGKVYGIDATPEMVFRARKTARENGFGNVEFRLGEIEHIPLESGVADVVISNCVINLSPDKGRVFEEAFRVLRPGGKLAVSDIVLLRPLPPEVEGDMAAWSSCVSGALPIEDYLRAIEAAGFEGVEVVDKVEYTDEQLRSQVTAEPTTDLSSAVASARVVAFKPKG